MSAPGDALDGWLAAARAGSPEALGEALQACRGYLLLIAEQELDAELRAKGGASDLVQETFVKAHRHFAGFAGGPDDLRAWLRRILLNHLADFRAAYREAAKRQAAREVPLQGDDSAGAGTAAVPDAGPSPSRQAMAREEADEVRRLLDRLPDDYRTVLRLRYQEDRPFEEIAGLMNRSENAVRKLWARALERLHEEWEPGHDGRDAFPG
jgi:RNA polymerase sigma-70 factor (ECF subfamily)